MKLNKGMKWGMNTKTTNSNNINNTNNHCGWLSHIVGGCVMNMGIPK